MKLVLAEIRGNDKLNLREFNQSIVKIGRDQMRCNVHFDRAEWPMVSRLHAELRLEGNHCYLIDHNSTHGTFVDGQRVSATVELKPGSRFQLGQTGPVLSVELVAEVAPSPAKFSQTLIDSQGPKASQPGQPQSSPPPSPPTSPPVLNVAPEPGSRRESPPPKTPPKPQTQFAGDRVAPTLICESGTPAQVGQRFTLSKETTVIGREQSTDIPIDASVAAVSRRHAEVRRQSDNTYVLVDLNSFNGTLFNDQRITEPTPLLDGDRFRLGINGPMLRFSNPAGVQVVRAGQSDPIAAQAPVNSLAEPPSQVEIGQQTIVSRSSTNQTSLPATTESGPKLILRRAFGAQRKLSVGRAPDNDIQLDGLLISKYHARFLNTNRGVLVEDAGATNGVYLNGGMVSGKLPVTSEDVVQIGPFVLHVESGEVTVYDNRTKTRIDAIGISETVTSSRWGRSRKILDEVSLAIQPNEFVGVLGPSGSGKSTLIGALNGMRRTSRGRILINHLDLYQHLDSLKQSIGYVPQDDIMHRELTVYRTLYYVARLRLSRDVRRKEIDQIIAEVLEVTDLSDRSDTLISQLSGGQRKRVSIAVELITKPSVIFLDEPTSGLDPATEYRMMTLFRQIAESGRTVILTTHAMENVRLFDKIILLMEGRLIFYGTPSEALDFVDAGNFVELYSKIEEPIIEQTAALPPLLIKSTKAEVRARDENRELISEGVAETWRSRFLATDLYRRYIWEPLSLLEQETKKASVTRRRRGIIDPLLQWTTLTRRYTRVLARDKLNLAILFAQAPLIGLLTYLVVGKNDPRDFPFFIMALVSIWFGISVAARELVRERPVYQRERMVNLSLWPYVGSKLFVLSFIVGSQVLLLFGSLKILHFAGLMSLPGMLLGVPQLLVMILTGIVGIALGLFVSAMVKTSEMASSLVPLLLIPQILFGGLVGVPTGVSRGVGAVMPATWSFDEIKRLSTLDTLKAEGSDPLGPNKGRGLYQHVKDLNAEQVEQARRQLDDYRKSTIHNVEEQARQAKDPLSRSTNSVVPGRDSLTLSPVGPPPAIPEAVPLGDDLSAYVNFMHPWGNRFLNPVILICMIFGFLIATLITLKTRDPG